jgi:transposase
MVFPFSRSSAAQRFLDQWSRIEAESDRLMIRLQHVEDENLKMATEVRALQSEALALRTENGCLRDENTALKEENRELKARLGQDSHNSSKPPSGDPPWKPPRSGNVPTGRKRGAQPGHPGHHRELLPLDQVDKVVTRDPEACANCGFDLMRSPRLDMERWQVTEIPEIKPEVTEFQLGKKCCPCCHAWNCGTLPGNGPRSAFGPNLQATACLMSGKYKLTFQLVHNLLTDVFHVPISVGSIQACRRAGTQACAPAVEACKAEVKAAPLIHADETGFEKCQGERMWLWVATTATAEVFLVLPGRGFAQAAELLGERYSGTIVRDRWQPYEQFPLASHQLCWSHLRRNIQAILETKGETGVQAAMLKLASDKAFACWERFKAGELNREQLIHQMKPIREEFRNRLGLIRADPAAPRKGLRLAKDMLRQEASLWTYLTQPSCPPTNNNAERSLRPAVIWRKITYGANVPDGCRFVGSILTIIGTARKRGVDVRGWLGEAIRAFREGKPPPLLTPA